MLSLFEYTQKCEETFSLMKLNKSDLRVRMTDQLSLQFRALQHQYQRLWTGPKRITVQAVWLIVSTLVRFSTDNESYNFDSYPLYARS
jgi:hypothetical protein